MEKLSVDNRKFNINEVKVEITFELGRKIIPMNELPTIGTGYTFEFDCDNNGTVAIDPNINAGEMVQIGDHYGVRGMELHDGDV